MKKLRLLFLLPLALFAAAAPTVTETLVRIQTDVATGRAEAYYEKAVTVDGVTYRQPWTQYSWAIGGSEPVTITLADGSTATTTRAHILTAVRAIADEVKAAAQ